MLKKIISKLDDTIDNVSSFVKREFFEPDDIVIQTYRGYGNNDEFRLMGRVLEIESHLEEPENAHEAKQVIQNAWYMFKRFESDEIAGVTVKLDVNGNTYSTITDKEGYFKFEICEKLESGWNELEVHIDANEAIHNEKEVRNKAFVLIPQQDADLGIISDIDDTIMKSYIPKPLKMLKELVFNGARARVAFEGAGKFYQALAKGKDTPDRPLFFVSVSPWNIYDVLIEFINHNGFPKAPLFLKELGVTDQYIFSKATVSHKLSYISELLDFYSSMNFILIGDSGQEDAEIYTEVIKKYPSRIKVVYIRDVIEGKKSLEFKELVKEISDLKSELVVFEKTEEAAQHARENALITQQKKKEVEAIPETIEKE